MICSRSKASFRLTLLLGVVGNLLILVAILGYKKMKSPTNIFLASLALADLLLCLICIPVKVKKPAVFSKLLKANFSSHIAVG